jgi:hypothetical protein
MFKWGSEEYETESEVIDAIISYVSQELENRHLDRIEGSEGRRFVIAYDLWLEEVVHEAGR